MKKSLKAIVVIGIVIGVIAIVLVLPLGILHMFGIYTEWQENNWYMTQNINKYGKVTHNGKNEIPEEFIHSFFPETIEPYFADVTYQYKARSWCDYCCEMQLTFIIEDRQTYLDYVADVTDGMEGTVFSYDDRYIDYVVCDDMDIMEPREETDSYYLEGSKMGRILVCDAEQKIIYHAFMVSNCCGTYSDNLDFFSQYDIDMAELAAQSRIIGRS